MNEPLVSVCVPAYNNEMFIRDAIQSVINQTYQNWEMIISDDASKDATLAIIKTFHDSRIVLFENKVNLGLGGNWNKVVQNAKGTFVKLLCGDDLLAPDCLEKQVAIFLSDKGKELSLIISYRNIIDEKGKILMSRKFPVKAGFINSSKAMRLNFLFGTNIIGEPAVGLFRLSAFSEIGYYDASNSYLIDLDFWFRLLLTGNLYVIPKPLASFRISKGAMTSQLKKNQAKLFMLFAKKIYDDKRFKLNLSMYFFSCFTASLMQILRRLFMLFHIK